MPAMPRNRTPDAGAVEAAIDALRHVSTPALVVDLVAFRENVAAARALVEGTGKVLRPHVKTHRTPGLALLQLGPGTRGVTCATVGEAEAMVAAGIDDVLLANEVVSPDKAERLVALGERARVTVSVDSPTGVELLASMAGHQGPEVEVLVDVDVGLGRCGVPGAAAAVELAAAVVEAPGLRLAGIMGYEGRLRAANPERPDRLRRAATTLADVRLALERAGFEVRTVSAGGTSTLHDALADPVATEIQAGTYALMEADLDGLGLPFRAATSVVATVISRRGPRIVLDAGRKSIGSDYGAPIPIAEGARTMAFHEEHTIVEWPGEPPEMGDRVALRPGHVRTTFNLHDRVWLVEGGSVVDRLPVTARGRSD
jgi:D-serine deaminase-like pyridoxal phosphate-dependent protein